MSIKSEIEHLRKSQAQATPGAWYAFSKDALVASEVRAVMPDGAYFVAEAPSQGDVHAIAFAHNHLPRLLDALEAVVAMHRPETIDVNAVECNAGLCTCEGEHHTTPLDVCTHCARLGEARSGDPVELWVSALLVEYPCPTVRALSDALWVQP